MIDFGERGMAMEKQRIGVALSGSFCTFDRVIRQIEGLVAMGHQVTPIVSFHTAQTDTRFGTAQDILARLETVCGTAPLRTLPQVEPLGPKDMLDALVVAPCTGTTLGRLAGGLSDTPVTLAVKSMLRRAKPIVLAVSTNDALGASMRNIGQLKNVKHLYFVPMRQDDPVVKPNSLVADFEQVWPTVQHALRGEQIQPLFIV